MIPTTHEFNNEATQVERKAVLENDTYNARAQHTVDDAGGRYAKINSTTVTGATPTPQYPKIPSGPWSGDDPAPTEEPLGFSVEDVGK